MNVRHLLLPFLVVLVPSVGVAACGDAAGTTVAMTAGRGPAASVSDESGSDSLGSLYEFKGRDCGSVSVGHDWEVPGTASECFLDAWRAGEAAYVTVTGPTIEGAPVTRAFQVTGDEEFDFLHDSRKDSLGSEAVRLFHCTTFMDPPADLLPVYGEPSGCSPMDGEVLASS